MKKNRPYFRKTDILIILLVLLISAGGIVHLVLSHYKKEAPSIAEIRINARLEKEIHLASVSEPYEIIVEGKIPVTLKVSKDGVQFIKSDCADGLCLHSGLIEANESAACLPAGVSVTVRSEGKTDIDAVVG